MSRANAAFAEPREREFELELPAGDVADLGAGEKSEPSPLLPSGAELLLREIGGALNRGLAAYAQLLAAREARDKDAMRGAAAQLVTALSCDPKALARQLSKQIDGVRL